ncbi:hypothetical protein cyc_08382 [Cyclospora cayetanensis]|uniref:Uncharacterized protein n=1 Tax=Cyclospora cayetanensis TaxID=88456 RepID=A0A1D3D1J4_9EIME|nr:hypothetical protein cyc_08382 [Cyclospora cayetanensis]
MIWGSGWCSRNSLQFLVSGFSLPLKPSLFAVGSAYIPPALTGSPFFHAAPSAPPCISRNPKAPTLAALTHRLGAPIFSEEAAEIKNCAGFDGQSSEQQQQTEATMSNGTRLRGLSPIQTGVSWPPPNSVSVDYGNVRSAMDAAGTALAGMSCVLPTNNGSGGLSVISVPSHDAPLYNKVAEDLSRSLKAMGCFSVANKTAAALSKQWITRGASGVVVLQCTASDTTAYRCTTGSDLLKEKKHRDALEYPTGEIFQQADRESLRQQILIQEQRIAQLHQQLMEHQEAREQRRRHAAAAAGVAAAGGHFSQGGSSSRQTSYAERKLESFASRDSQQLTARHAGNSTKETSRQCSDEKAKPLTVDGLLAQYLETNGLEPTLFRRIRSGVYFYGRTKLLMKSTKQPITVPHTHFLALFERVSAYLLGSVAIGHERGVPLSLQTVQARPPAHGPMEECLIFYDTFKPSKDGEEAAYLACEPPLHKQRSPRAAITLNGTWLQQEGPQSRENERLVKECPEEGE